MASLALLPAMVWAPVSTFNQEKPKTFTKTVTVDNELVALQVKWVLEDSNVQPKTTKVWARVTACSPDDPKDVNYYKKNGYKGSTYNIAANYGQFPKGTLIKVPGYMDKRFPNQFWEVDSAGGSSIRRSVRNGVVHIDVKFATYVSAKAWGSKWMYIDVIYPSDK